MIEAKIEINHKKLLQNINTVKNVVGKKTKIMAIVKSNAYGHGMKEVAKTLEKQVDMFGVGFLNEAIELRSTTDKDILIMGPCYDFDEVVENNLTITLESFNQFNALALYCEKHLKAESLKIKVHLKVDTGMHRFGFLENEIIDLINLMENKKVIENIIIEGVYSHFAEAYSATKKNSIKQYEIFKRIKTLIRNKLGEDIIFHIANSENALCTDLFRDDMVRIGNGLYGPMKITEDKEIKQISSVKLPIISIHRTNKKTKIGYGLKKSVDSDTRIGLVGGGFYEGIGLCKSPIGISKFLVVKYYLKNIIKTFMKKEFALYEDKKLEIIGMINMQFFAVDLTNTEIMVGDFVELHKAPLYFKNSIKRIHKNF